ncbi:MAG: hypothetical protein P8Y70_21305 [Candidatus Lokiarchaeota archaeon]
MTELKISLPEELVKKIKKHPEINWAFIASNAIKKYIIELESHEESISIEELHKLSEYSLKKFLENEPDLYSDQDLIKRYR